MAFADAGMPFDSAEHWQTVFPAYAHFVVPKELFGNKSTVGQRERCWLAHAR
jgi:hypothetical protein